jgi:hypothetical protein
MAAVNFHTGRAFVKLNLNTGFLLFARKFTKEDLKASEIFSIIHEYFFNYKDITRKVYESKIAEGMALELPINDSGDGIFYNLKERHALFRGLVSEEDKKYMKLELLKKEKIINSVRLFKQMLIEHEIEFHLINRKNDKFSIVSSSNIFSIKEDFTEILSNNFESYQDCDIKYHEDTLIQSIEIFFGDFKGQNPNYKIYREDEYVDTVMKLFAEDDVLKILKDYPNDEDWQDHTGDGSKVAICVHRLYGLKLTVVKNFIMPMIRSQRRKFSGE